MSAIRESQEVPAIRHGGPRLEIEEDFLDSGDVALRWVDPEGKILWANHGDYESLGYSAEEFIGRNVREFHHDGDVFMALLRRLQAGEPVRSQALTLRRRDGAARQVVLSASPRFDEQGALVHVRCCMLELPEPSVSEAHPAGDDGASDALTVDALRRTTQQLQMIADALPVLVGYIDAELRYRFANSAYEAWFGHPRQRIIGLSMIELLGPVAFETVRSHVARVLGGETATFEAVVSYREAGVRFVRATYVPHHGPSGEVEGFVALVSDMSAERRIAAEREELLRTEQNARERLSVLTRVSDTLAQSLDYERTLHSVTELAMPLLGDFGFFDIFEGEEVRRIARVHENPEAEELLRRTRWLGPGSRSPSTSALTSGKGGLYPHIDGAWFEAVGQTPENVKLLRTLGARSMITVPLRYQDQTLGALTLYFGTSGRRHDERDLELAEEISRRAAAAIVNARLFKEAREAISVRDDFLSMAGHELRTPLTALQLQILSISKMIGQADGAEKIAARAEKAGRNVLRLSSLVNELLDISRISAGRLRLEHVPMSLGEAVREVVQRHADELQRNGCEVRFSADPDSAGVWDRVRIEQVATNLLANAMKYGKGKPIEIKVERDGDRVRLIVQDHGIGISPEDQQRVFQRFERAVSSRHFGGLGLGLWIARQLVDAHGGTIRVRSEKEQGATFEVELPSGPPEEEVET